MLPNAVVFPLPTKLRGVCLIDGSAVDSDVPDVTVSYDDCGPASVPSAASVFRRTSEVA